MPNLRRSSFLRHCVIAALCLAGPICKSAHGQTLSVSASPSNVNFTLPRNGVASGDSVISITTSWVISIPPFTITLYAFTSSTTAALTDGAGAQHPDLQSVGERGWRSVHYVHRQQQLRAWAKRHD